MSPKALRDMFIAIAVMSALWALLIWGAVEGYKHVGR